MVNKDVRGRTIREHEAHSYRSEHGKSSIIIKCPFCGSSVVAYVWSLAGSGKRCDECSAIHYTCVSAKMLEDNK